jgi:hypothetical protein
MKVFIQRLKAETPVFFKKLRNVAISISGACSSVAIFHAQLPPTFSQFIPVELVKSLAIAGFVAAFVSQLTKTDNQPPANTPRP